MPHHPEIVVKLPDESVGEIRLSIMVGRLIRRYCGNEVAHDYYLETKWAKRWPDLVKVIREWVTVDEHLP